MVELSFQDTVEEASEVEEKALSHIDYSGSFEIRRVIDFDPEKYADYIFDDLLNMYDRSEKVIKASQLNIYSSQPITPAPEIKQKSVEIENKVKEISEESLHHADVMAKELEKTPELKAPEQVKYSFEFEKGWEPEEKKEEQAAEAPSFEPGLELKEEKETPKATPPEEEFGEAIDSFKDEREEKKAEPETEIDTSDLVLEHEKPETEEEKPKEVKPIQKRSPFEFSFEKEEPTEEKESEPTKLEVEEEVEKPEELPIAKEKEEQKELPKEAPKIEKPPEAKKSKELFSQKIKEIKGPKTAEELVEVESKKELKPLQRALEKIKQKKMQKAGVAPAPEQVSVPEVVERPSVPPVLSSQKEEVPATVFEKIQSSFDSEWGEERNESKIKYKMLELTKELFREKSTARREEIKQQIVVLKNLLAKPPPKSEKPKQVKKEDFEYSAGLLSTLSNTLSMEFSSTLNSVSASAEKEISAARTQFQNSLLETPEEDEEARKTAFDKLVFAVTKVSEESEVRLDKSKSSLVEKHLLALDQFVQSLDSKDTANADSARKKKSEIKESYEKDATLLKTSIKNKANSLIEAMSHIILVSPKKEVLPPIEKPTVKAKEKPKKTEAEIASIILEVNSTDEGSLLYYLHSHDLETYRKFERGHLSRQAALLAARKAMAKEKGLDASTIGKNWGMA